MKKIVLALLLFLGACNQRPASDGYDFEQSSTRLGTREIVVTMHPSESALLIAYNAKTGSKRVLNANETLFGFTSYNTKTCTINIIDPKVKYVPEAFGHELTHCLYGEFHPSQNERI